MTNDTQLKAEALKALDDSQNWSEWVADYEAVIRSALSAVGPDVEALKREAHAFLFREPRVTTDFDIPIAALVCTFIDHLSELGLLAQKQPDTRKGEK